MGGAKRKRAQREEDHLLSKHISRTRFHLHVLGTRRSLARVMAEELHGGLIKTKRCSALCFVTSRS